MLTLAIALVLSVPQADTSMQLTAVRELMCDDRLGTAWVVAPGVVATAKHVMATTGCHDSETGASVKPIAIDDEHDFALLAMDTQGMPVMRHTCERFRSGQKYYTYGYGEGTYQVHELLATGMYTGDSFKVEDGTVIKGMRFLRGLIVSGQSGGPIISEDGVVYGINNVSNGRNRAYSYELADTPLCKK